MSRSSGAPGRAFVGFAGSRAFVSGGHPFVGQVVASVVSAGRGVAVGCAVGVDAAVLRARLALPFPSSSSGPALSVFAAGGPLAGKTGLFGFWGASAVSLVQEAASLSRSPGHGCWSPVSVAWWAGGGGPLRSRLRSRSRSMVSFVAVSGRGAGLVAFVSGGWSVSPGSWGTVSAAVGFGLPVVVFPFAPGVPGPRDCFWGFVSGAPPSLRWPRRFGSVSGRWSRAGSGPVWSRGFRFVPASSG